MTPCDLCGVKIDTDIHAEEMGMCVECSAEWWAHSDDGHVCSWGCISYVPEKKGNKMKFPEMKPYEFTITGTVYAGSDSHAMHFVYWATHDGGIDNYRDASAAGIYNWKHDVKERKEK